jgi:hypothetical protein
MQSVEGWQHQFRDAVYKIKWYKFPYAAFHLVSCDLVTKTLNSHENVYVEKYSVQILRIPPLATLRQDDNERYTYRGAFA